MVWIRFYDPSPTLPVMLLRLVIVIELFIDCGNNEDCFETTMNSKDQEAILFGDLWRIQESLLQAYRVMFILAESNMIAAAAILFSTAQAFVFGIPILLLGLAVIPVWVGVCHARANAVAFVHWLIQKHEAGEEIVKPYSHFRQFQKDRTYNGQNVFECEAYRNLSKSKTRNRIDVVIPLCFFITWITLLVMAIVSIPV